MTEEFNLSNRIIEEVSDVRSEDILLKEDVEEFIKRLKIEMDLSWDNCQIINKLAGDKFK